MLITALGTLLLLNPVLLLLNTWEKTGFECCCDVKGKGWGLGFRMVVGREMKGLHSTLQVGLERITFDCLD